MANIFTSSIGKKLIMSITGFFLILFLTFHMCMNLVALISPEGYNMICGFLGANWYALIGTMVLAAGAVIHILYAFLLYFYNRRARGNVAYAVKTPHKEIEWASQNMLVLGIVIAAFLVLHLYNLWAKMQLVELMHKLGMHVSDTALTHASDGVYHLAATFSDPITVVLYIIAVAALWFHLTHGFWSAFQSVGINNHKWLKRLQVVAKIYATVIAIGFAIIPVCFFFGLHS